MDNITHSLVGIALSRVFFKKRVAFATSAMVVAANLPDLDILYSWPGIRYIEFHRGVLHSIWMLPVWAVLVAFGLRWLTRRQKLPVPAWGIAFLLGAVGVASHLLLDWTNAYGIRLFAPIGERWYALDLMPILDPWVWLLLATFLVFPMMLALIVNEVGSKKGNNSHRVSAALALVLLVGWVGLRARQHAAALELLNSPAVEPYFQGQLPYDWGAFPNSSTPFDWQAVVDLPGNVLIADVASPWDADAGSIQLLRNYIKPPRVPAIVAAQRTHTGGIFLWFARFPLSDIEDDNVHGLLVTITDLRFAQGVARPDLRAQIRLNGDLSPITQSFHW